MPAFYRQSIQNAVNQQINIGKSKHRTTLNREAIGQVVSYCAVAAAHDLWDWGEKESTLLTLKILRRQSGLSGEQMRKRQSWNTLQTRTTTI